MNVSQHITCAICNTCHRCQIWLHAVLALLRGDVFSFFFTFRKTVVCPPWKTISDENFCGEAAREWNYESQRERERSKLDNIIMEPASAQDPQTSETYGEDRFFCDNNSKLRILFNAMAIAIG